MQANRTLDLLSRMFNMAESWGLMPEGSNPCRHQTKYREQPRERFLTAAEFRRLGRALDEAEACGAAPSGESTATERYTQDSGINRTHGFPRGVRIVVCRLARVTLTRKFWRT